MTIVIGYLYLIAKEAEAKRILVQPYDTNFFTLLSTLLLTKKENQIKDVVNLCEAELFIEVEI
jgi:23S rRNA maturation mini-RNase III